MATAFADEVVHLRRDIQLSDDDISRATGAGRSTVRSWLRRSRTPTGARAERIAELVAVVERLRHLMDPSYIPVWLRTPLAGLDDDKPVDVLGRGEYRRVSALIAALESPVVS